MKDSRIKACIIGAGAAGLCAARHLAEFKSQFVFDMFEQTCNVGGTWNYTEYIGLDSNGIPIHTSMYKNMRYKLFFNNLFKIKSNHNKWIKWKWLTKLFSKNVITKNRTNLPVEIMEFPDFPSSSCTSFVHHSQVLQYLQNYAKHFNLIQYIQVIENDIIFLFFLLLFSIVLFS